MNEELMKLAGFEKEVNLVKQGKCPICESIIQLEDFRNEISRKEFLISGFCQKCQDEIFNPDNYEND